MNMLGYSLVGHFVNTLCTLVGHFGDTSRTPSGHLLTTWCILVVHGVLLVCVLVVRLVITCWPPVVNLLEVCWRLFGNRLETSWGPSQWFTKFKTMCYFMHCLCFDSTCMHAVPHVFLIWKSPSTTPPNTILSYRRRLHVHE